MRRVELVLVVLNMVIPLVRKEMVKVAAVVGVNLENP